MAKSNTPKLKTTAEINAELNLIAAEMEPNPTISTRYDYKSIDRPEVSFDPTDPKSVSVTNQSDKDSSDINLIMKRYEKTGMISDLLTGQQRQPQYGDFSDVGDYHAIKSNIARVEQAFDAYPASLREYFGNDPANLINFLADPNNDGEAIKLGLKPKPDLPPATEEEIEADKPKSQPVNPAANRGPQPVAPAAPVGS